MIGHARIIASYLVVHILLVSHGANALETIPPLHGEGGPILSPGVGTNLDTQVWVSIGGRWGSRDRGRAEYRAFGTRTELGGQWHTPKIDWLALSAELVAFQTNTLIVDLPPAIDESESYFDLGPLRLLTKAQVFDKTTRGKLKFAITPFFRATFPTDTSRVRENRRMPIREVIDDTVIQGPYFLFEPGASASMAVGVFSAYLHQSFLFAPVVNDKLHFFYSAHIAAAVRVAKTLDIIAGLDGLMRTTTNLSGHRLAAWAFSPGLRLNKNAFSYELGTKIGLGDDAYAPFGAFTAFFTLYWRPQDSKGQE